MIIKFIALIILFVIAILQGIFTDHINKNKWLKISLIILLLSSLIVGLVVMRIDESNSNKISEQQKGSIDSLRIENATLISKLDSLYKALNEGMKNRSLQEIQMSQKVNELNSKLEPFVKIALTKYPAYDIQSALNSLANDIENTKRLAEPPKLIPSAKEITKNDGGLTLLLQFKSNKNEPLGMITFYADIENNNSSKILEFHPSVKGGAFSSGPDSEKIEPNGKSGRLIYSLIGVGNPTFEIKVSKATNIKITSNYLTEPFIIKIE